jgi:chromosome segregation ATPase
MKTLISIIGLAGLVVFLALWLNASSNLGEARDKLTSAERQIADLENKNRDLQQDFSKSKSDLSTAQAALVRSAEDVKNKDTELSRLNDANSSLSKSLSQAEADLNKLKAGQADSQASEDAQKDYLNQLAGLTARLTALADERELLSNKLEQAEKTLESYRSR